MSFIQHVREKNNRVLRVRIQRPEARNALNFEMIRELRSIFMGVMQKKNDTLRLVTIEAEGPHFCAGADLKWMKASAQLSESENQSEAKELFEMYQSVYDCPLPVFTKVKGAAMGGALGLVACSDHVVASHDAFFSLSEVKLGLIPATIGPFVIQKIGFSQFQSLSIRASRIPAEQALAIGLIHDRVSKNVDQHFETEVDNALKNGPEAMKQTKALGKSLGSFSPSEFKKQTSSLIAKIRASDEAQRGLEAFFKKETPKW